MPKTTVTDYLARAAAAGVRYETVKRLGVRYWAGYDRPGI
jgi:hypothetical protein